MVKNHIIRVSAPKRWDVLRKKYAFITRPNPGRDSSLSISLNTIFKEMLAKTKTTKESKYLIKKVGVFVNGRRHYDEKFSVGFLDVVSFPALKEHYRLLVNQKNKLFLTSITEEESKIKLSKILNKTQLSKDKTQINCADGRNFILGKDSPVLKEAKTNDSIVYTVPDQKIKQIIKLEKGAIVFLYKGKHAGLLVNVDNFDRDNIVFKRGKDVFETKKAYSFAVGKTKSVITVSNGAANSINPDKNTKENTKAK